MTRACLPIVCTVHIIEDKDVIIAVIEDHVHFLRLLRNNLCRNGDQWIEVDPKVQEDSFLGDVEPDWVILSLELKDGASPTVLNDIKQSYPKSKILGLSQFDDPEIRTSAYESGVAKFRVKDDLAGIRDVLHGRPMEAPSTKGMTA